MKTNLFKLFTGYGKTFASVTKIFNLQFAPSTGNQHAYGKVSNKKIRFSASLSVFITLVLLTLSGQIQAQQITDKTIFPLNEYLRTDGINAYPIVNDSLLKKIDTLSLTNVMNYGAKGDGKTLDDNAIKQAFQNARVGVFFPAGRTYLVSTPTKITATHDYIIYAYGATIKMKDLTRYSFLNIQYASGTYHNKVLWLGGTFDGNQYNQIWPGNPHGGKYNGAFVESHGRFVGVNWAQFVMFKDVNVFNTVVDGPTAESCKMAVFADSKASGGANFHYNTEYGSAGVGDQGAYFKVTRNGYKTAYFLNLDCTGGSIGTFLSLPEVAGTLTTDTQTLSIHANCKIWNTAQDIIHIEDCYKNFFFNCNIGADIDGHSYIPRVHISNRTGIMTVIKSSFTNAWLNFNQSASLKLGIVDSCTFSTTKSNYLQNFINGRPHILTRSTFAGICSAQQANALNTRKSTFSSFGNSGIVGTTAVDSCTFVNGVTPVTTGKTGFVVNTTFQQVTKTAYNTKPSSSDWAKVFSSYVDVYSDANKYLGRIGGGTDTFQNQTALTNQPKAVSASAARKFSSNIAYGFDSVQHQAVPANIAASNSKVVGFQAEIIRLYPNPTTDVLHVSLNEKLSGKIALNIYDQQGRLVQSKSLDKKTAMLVETMNVNNLTAGAYFLQIISEQQKSTVKFVVAR